MTGDKSSRILTRKTIWPGRTVHLDLERVVLPNGAVTEMEIVHHSGAACVVAFVSDDEILLERMFRHAVGARLLEVPAGKLDPGEQPEDCARRELEEETGWRVGTLERLGAIHPTPGFCDEIVHVFRARGLRPGVQALGADEDLTVERVPFAEALAMARDGRICDGKTVAALALASWIPG